MVFLIVGWFSSEDVKEKEEILGIERNINEEIAITEENPTRNNFLALQTTGTDKLYKVVKVVDGDTISVNIGGVNTSVRMIGIDTPETVDPRKPVQCFGQEASNKAKATLSNQMVYLELDPSQGKYDKYDRLLAYVFLANGTNFNELMIKDGYAYEYTYSTPYKYQSAF